MPLDAAQHELRLRAEHGDRRPQLMRRNRQELIPKPQCCFGRIPCSAFGKQRALQLLFDSAALDNFDLERGRLLLKGRDLAQTVVAGLQV